MVSERKKYEHEQNNHEKICIRGAVDGHLTRKTPPSYADGVYMMSGGDRYMCMWDPYRAYKLTLIQLNLPYKISCI